MSDDQSPNLVLLLREIRDQLEAWDSVDEFWGWGEKEFAAGFRDSEYEHQPPGFVQAYRNIRLLQSDIGRAAALAEDLAREAGNRAQSATRELHACAILLSYELHEQHMVASMAATDGDDSAAVEIIREAMRKAFEGGGEKLMALAAMAESQRGQAAPATPPLPDRLRYLLEAMDGTTANQPKKKAQIARELGYKNPDSLNDPLAELVRLGLAGSKPGRHGGYYAK